MSCSPPPQASSTSSIAVNSRVIPDAHFFQCQYNQPIPLEITGRPILIAEPLPAREDGRIRLAAIGTGLRPSLFEEAIDQSGKDRRT